MSNTEALIGALETLELPHRVSLKEIRAQYRRLALAHHPDRNPGGAARDMAQITAAYRLLADYCEAYPVPFRSEDVRPTDGEWWCRHFGSNM